MMRRAPFPTLLLLLCIAGVATVTSQVTVLPECYSTTEAYVVQQLTIPIQPQTPITIRRFQGPQLRLFCISFEESSPTCSSSATPVPQLCSRPTADSSVAFTCESLTDFTTNVNARITRGSINGPDMTWLVRWDGTTQGLDCYPKVVLVRMMILVDSQKVNSTALFVIMLIIAILVVLLMLVALYAFLYNRYMQIDEAGAVTIGGPGPSYRGPQMAITAPTQAVGSTKILLPVRDGDPAITDMRGNNFGMITQNGEEFSTEDILMPRGPRMRRSPPPPGDGVRDGMFPSPRRRRDESGALLGEGEDYGDEEYYSPGGTRRRRPGSRPGRRPGRGGRPDEDDRPGGAVFPTQSEWEAAPMEQSGIDGTTGLPIGANGQFRTIKYIPSWMQGNFGKGGQIPQMGDGEDEEEYSRSIRDSTIEMASSGSKAFGIYKQSPRRRGGSTMDGEEENYGPGSGNRFGSNLKRRRGGGGGLKEASPNGRQLFSESEEDSFGRRGRRRRPGTRGGGGNGDRLSRNYDEDWREDEEEDNFQRNRARLSNGVDLDTSRRQNQGAASRMDGTERQTLEGRNNTSVNQPAPAAFTCKYCNVVLTGTSSDPPFCVVTGERHT